MYLCYFLLFLLVDVEVIGLASLGKVWYFFSFSFVPRGRFLVFFAPFPEEEISDYKAQGSFIRVLTVPYTWIKFVTPSKN